MPNVSPLKEGVVQYARDLAFDPINRRLIMITPNREIKTSINLPPKDTLPQEFIAHLESLAPSTEQWLIVAIGMTEFKAVKEDPYQCVPFLGSLEGFVQLGHAVILFEGHTNALPEVCENADMLIIDERMIQHMKKDWLPIVLSVMRNDYIIRVKVDDAQVLGAERLVLKT
ncbi:MAG: hypothetical protein KTR29_06385 [Rhodothermaceae bacterium]|nr:hypothetical protein [Rhodothermaceae bacterium]